MDQLKNYADGRLLQGCIYCESGKEETRDHVPSRVLLERPFPTNLPVMPACIDCNNDFSLDEEYVACLIECAIAGSTDPENISSLRVASILRRRPALRTRIEESKSVVNGNVSFAAEEERVNNVVLKLARGHASFELGSAFRQRPTSLMWWPMSIMSEEQRDSYDASHVTKLFGEVGSRGMQRMLSAKVSLRSPTGESSMINLVINDWVDVQEGRYRYLAIDDIGGVKIKFVLSEFLACEVSWGDPNE